MVSRAVGSMTRGVKRKLVDNERGVATMRPMNKNALDNAKLCIDTARTCEASALSDKTHPVYAREDANLSVELWARAVASLLAAAL
jgi:hypothetical protein